MSQGNVLRVAVFGQSGPFAGAGMQALLRRLPSHVRIVLVVEAPGHKRRPQGGFGWGLAQPRTPLSAERRFWDLEHAARHVGAAYSWCATGGDGRVAAAARRARVDIGAAIGLPFRIADAVRHACGGVLNVHPSALPRWRGAAPLFWWLRSGEPQTAISVHLMHHGLDAGPLLDQRPFVAPPQASGEQLQAQAGAQGGAQLAAVLHGWAGGARLARPQPPGNFERAPRPRAVDGHIVPHQWPARTLARFLAGAPFFVTPSFVLAGQRYFAADDADGVALREEGPAMPGEFTQVGASLWLAARGGLVRCRVQR